MVVYLFYGDMRIFLSKVKNHSVWIFWFIRTSLHFNLNNRWSLIEVPRYLFYLLKLLEVKIPTWLLFLRYNLFFGLYPAGISGEILTIINALPYIKENLPFSISLPNKCNFVFNYYYFSLFWLCIYIPSTSLNIDWFFSWTSND